MVASLGPMPGRSKRLVGQRGFVLGYGTHAQDAPSSKTCPRVQHMWTVRYQWQYHVTCTVHVARVPKAYGTTRQFVSVRTCTDAIQQDVPRPTVSPAHLPV